MSRQNQKTLCRNSIMFGQTFLEHIWDLQTLWLKADKESQISVWKTTHPLEQESSGWTKSTIRRKGIFWMKTNNHLFKENKCFSKKMDHLDKQLGFANPRAGAHQDCWYLHQISKIFRRPGFKARQRENKLREDGTESQVSHFICNM